MKSSLTRSPSRMIAFGAMALGVLLSGCSSTRLPSPQLTATMATANETVKQARDVDAQEHAPLELQMAEQKMKAAQTALADENLELAGRLASEAMVDARLAAIKSRSAEKQAIVLELQQSIKVLREEIERSKKG